MLLGAVLHLQAADFLIQLIADQITKSDQLLIGSTILKIKLYLIFDGVASDNSDNDILKILDIKLIKRKYSIKFIKIH